MKTPSLGRCSNAYPLPYNIHRIPIDNLSPHNSKYDAIGVYPGELTSLSGLHKEHKWRLAIGAWVTQPQKVVSPAVPSPQLHRSALQLLKCTSLSLGFHNHRSPLELRQICIQVFGKKGAWLSGEGPVTFPILFFSEGRLIINSSTHDGVLLAGTAEHMKMVAVFHRGQCSITRLCKTCTEDSGHCHFASYGLCGREPLGIALWLLSLRPIAFFRLEVSVNVI